jgi:hypothetical protein
MPTCLRRWMYLDHEGIESLHGQITGALTVEQTKMLSSSMSRNGTGTIGFRAFGTGAAIEGGVSAQQQFQIFERSAPHDEKLLLDVESCLAGNGELEQVTRVRHLAEIFAKGQGAFVTGILRFRWASCFVSDPVDEATRKKMIEFEVDREANDDAGMLAVPVRMSGNLQKCVGRKNLHDGSVSPTSHFGVFSSRAG